ncbi:hypothetical protein P9E34_19680 [Schinkia azotoformans]|uniref:hypothetical protein n=1 Tax=Schinkia azotoformans TaxID=1454 RepID=UPI002DB90EAD|nr:hypothetical protein [Schinkia azotoformans]MEC1726933.1 hypothetical protein [Schinkia azotoformans]
MSDKWELHQETINETKDSCTIASYIREKGTDNDWMYMGAVTYYPNGDCDLEDSGEWE